MTAHHNRKLEPAQAHLSQVAGDVEAGQPPLITRRGCDVFPGTLTNSAANWNMPARMRWAALKLWLNTAQKPKPLPRMDALRAATALHHNLTPITRNTADFAGFGVPLLNSWGSE